MASRKSSPCAAPTVASPCTPPRRRRFPVESGSSTPSVASPSGNSPQDTPRSVKRRMLSRTQSLGTPEHSTSPFTAKLLQKSSSFDGNHFSDAEPPSSILKQAACEPLSYDVRPSRFSLIQCGPSLIPAGCSSQRSEEQSPFSAVQEGRVTYREQLCAAERAGSRTSTPPIAIDGRADDRSARSFPQSMSDLRSLGANRRFIDEVEYLLGPMTTVGARPEVKRAIGLEVIRKMKDHDWLAKLLACGDLTKVWQAFRSARVDSADLAFDNIMLLFCAKVLSTKTVCEALPGCVGLEGLADFVVDMLCQPCLFSTRNTNRKEAKKLGLIRDLYTATLGAANDDLSLLQVLAPRTPIMATYCASSLVELDFLHQVVDDTSANAAVEVCAARLANESDFMTSPLLHMSLLTMMTLTELYSGRMAASSLLGNSQTGRVAANVVMRLRELHEATNEDAQSKHVARSLILIARLVGWGLNDSPDWSRNFATPECIEALWFHTAELTSACASSPSRLEVADALALVLSLLLKLQVLSEIGQVIESQRVKLLQDILGLSTLSSRHSTDEDMQKVICRGCAALLVCTQDNEAYKLMNAVDLTIALKEFRHLNEALANAAVTTGFTLPITGDRRNTSVASIIVHSEQFELAIGRLEGHA